MISYSYEQIKVNEDCPGILTLILSRPESLNSLNTSLMNELEHVLIHIKESTEIKAVLLTGEGKAFCAGADITQLAKLDNLTGFVFSKEGQHLFRLIEALGKPTLAAINGFALGGGCELAMACTFRIATELARFGQPEVKLGVIPGFGGTQRLARLIGKGRALDLCLTGRIIHAQEALQWGLITEIVAYDRLLIRSYELLNEIKHMPPIAIQSIMGAIDQGYNLPLENALVLEALYFSQCCATQDKKEGTSAFLEKREAIFQGI